MYSSYIIINIHCYMCIYKLYNYTQVSSKRISTCSTATSMHRPSFTDTHAHWPLYIVTSWPTVYTHLLLLYSEQR